MAHRCQHETLKNPKNRISPLPHLTLTYQFYLFLMRLPTPLPEPTHCHRIRPDTDCGPLRFLPKPQDR